MHTVCCGTGSLFVGCGIRYLKKKQWPFVVDASIYSSGVLCYLTAEAQGSPWTSDKCEAYYSLKHPTEEALVNLAKKMASRVRV